MRGKMEGKNQKIYRRKKRKKMKKMKKLEKNENLPFVHVEPRVPDSLPARSSEGVEKAQGRGDVREARERAKKVFFVCETGGEFLSFFSFEEKIEGKNRRKTKLTVSTAKRAPQPQPGSP